MKTTEMQALIDHCGGPADMIAIARGYLDGAVLRDFVAAEAWLMKAIEAEEPQESPKAMALLAHRILGREAVLSDEDYQDIHRRADTAEGREREELLALLELGSERQKTLCTVTKKRCNNNGKMV